MFCRNCGMELQKDFSVCPSCGTPVKTQADSSNNAVSGGEEPLPFNQGGHNGGFNQPKSFPGFSRPVASFAAKNVQGWTGLFRVANVIYCIMLVLSCGFIGFDTGIIIDEITRDGVWTILCVILGVIVGLLAGIIVICKNKIFANIAENTNMIAKNTAENNKR